MAEAGVRHQPGQRRIGRQDCQEGRGEQQGFASDLVGQCSHHRQPEEIRQADAHRHQQGIQVRQVQLGLTERRCIGSDQVERHRGHHHQRHAGQDDAEVLTDGADDFRQGRAVLSCLELRRFLQGATDHEDRRYDHATDQERHTPAPLTHFLRAQPMIEANPQQTGEHHGGLLAGRLPTDKEALASGCGDFCQVHRHPTEFDPGGEALQQPAQQHQQRCHHAQGGVARYTGDQQGAGGHHRQGNDQAFAATMAVDVGAEKDRPQRAHQEPGAERGQGQHQRGESTVGGEERLGDGRGVEAIDHEVEHLQEVAADDAKNRLAVARVGRHV